MKIKTDHTEQIVMQFQETSDAIAAPSLVASNRLALIYLILPLALAVGGTYLTISSGRWYFWLAGQLALSVFFFQCFILLHETGHQSFFRSRTINKLLGHLFGFISFIPFQSWEAIHALHHKWTGWRDRDPTTESTVEPKFGATLTRVVNFCWRTGIPLFTLAYRFGNYWSHDKLRRFLSPTKVKAIYINQAVLIPLYAIVAVVWGEWVVLNLGLGYLLSLVLSDLFILSQHSHIDIPLANGQDVQPISYAKQIPYTRSLHINRWIESIVLLNFNRHELHHSRPGVPAYHLNRLTDPTQNTRPFWQFLARSKRMRGVEFIFSTTSKTGIEV